AGNDVFTGTPKSGTMQSAQQGGAGSYSNVAVGFGRVYATSTTGNDVATLFDSAGNDSFVGSRAFSYLTDSSSYFNQVSNFFEVSAVAGEGGSDTATVMDSVQNDVFEGTGGSGQVFSNDPGQQYVVEARAFSSLAAVTSHGGSDDYCCPGSLLKT